LFWFFSRSPRSDQKRKHKSRQHLQFLRTCSLSVITFAKTFEVLKDREKNFQHGRLYLLLLKFMKVSEMFSECSYQVVELMRSSHEFAHVERFIYIRREVAVYTVGYDQILVFKFEQSIFRLLQKLWSCVAKIIRILRKSFKICIQQWFFRSFEPLRILRSPSECGIGLKVRKLSRLPTHHRDVTDVLDLP